MGTEGRRSSADASGSHVHEGGSSSVEILVVVGLFTLMAIAAGAAFTTSGEVFGDGMARADLGALGRRVLGRILAEVAETQASAPDFSVGTGSVSFNRVEAVSSGGPVYGPQRTISYDKATGIVTLEIPANRVKETMTREATGLSFTLDGTLLKVDLTLEKQVPKGKLKRRFAGESNLLP